MRVQPAQGLKQHAAAAESQATSYALLFLLMKATCASHRDVATQMVKADVGNRSSSLCCASCKTANPVQKPQALDA